MWCWAGPAQDAGQTALPVSLFPSLPEPHFVLGSPAPAAPAVCSAESHVSALSSKIAISLQDTGDLKEGGS